MLSVDTARTTILSKAHGLPSETLALGSASGRYLAEDFLAPFPLPLFNQSAMDGYALRHQDLRNGFQLKVTHEIKAGDPADVQLVPGEAIRIFTGAQVPESADTIVMQELVQRAGDFITVTGEVKPGSHLRHKGEQLQKGDVALSKGQLLNPAALGLLASMGINKVEVSTLPVVAILTTGSEFAESEEDLSQGKIFESNSLMLQGALQQMGLNCFVAQVKDEPDTILERIQEISKKADVLLTTGGVSVGKYDHTRPSLERAGFEVVFHKINQKPGKPLLFASKGKKVAFGLPGNPRSALMSFYQYVYPYLKTLLGAKAIELPHLQLPLAADYYKKDGKVHFVSAEILDGQLLIQKAQQSHLLKSLAVSQLMVEIPALAEPCLAESLVKTWFLPR